MSIDVASLVFEIDSTQAVTARQRLEDLEKAGDRVDAMARKVRTATDRLNEGHRSATATAAAATQGATSLAQAHGAVERATRAASEATSALRAQRQLDAAAMRESAKAARDYERDQARGKAAADALRASIDPLSASIGRLNDQLVEAGRLNAMGFLSDEEHSRAVAVLTQRQNALIDAQGKGVKSSRALTIAGLDLSRQFADIGVTAAMGMNPLMILIQQGPQIADRLALMKMEGIGLGAALRGIVVAAAPVLVALAPIALVAGAAFGAAALAARDLNKDNKDLADSLGLTEKQLDRLKEKGVETGVTIGDVFKGTFNYIREAVTPSLAPLAKWFSDLFDSVASASVTTVKLVGGAFVGAFEAIKTTWSALPSALGDVAVQAANAVIRAVEGMINRSLAAYNKALPAIRALMTATGNGAGALGLHEAGPVDLGSLSNPWAGAAGKAMADGAAAFKKANDSWASTVDSVGKGLRKSILDARDARVTKAAGDAGKDPRAPKSPADRSDERLAQYEAALAAARAEELQAQLALVEDTKARAALEKEILDVQLAEKRADLDRQAAKVEADVAAKRITEVTGDLLLMEIEALKLSAARVAALREEKINRDAARQATRDDYDIRAAGIQDQIDLLESQKATAKFAFQRRAIDREILEHQQRIERLKLEEIIATTASTSAEYKIAEARLKVLDAIQANERKAAEQTPQQVLDELSGTLQGVIDAFQRQDWEKVVTGLIEAFGALKDAFTRAGVSVENKIGAIAGVGSVIGNAIGGKAGSTISGAASGAMAGLTFGPIGAAVGAVIGGISGFLSGSKAEKQRRQAEELAKQQAEHARALQLANDKREQEIRLLELTGRASEALKFRREAELAAMDASLQANQLRIWALEDEAEAAAKTADLQIRLMDAQGRASESLALKRAREIASANDNERGMLRQIFAAEDVATARDALSAAYERESAALQATIDKFRAFADGLKRFRDQLYSGPAAMLSPEEQYRATKANFDRTAALAAGGNEDAIRDLESVSQAYLDASKAYYASSEAYFADLERVRAAVTATQAYAASQVSAAEAQLSALNASVAGILGVQGAVLSVKDALAAYNAAIQAQFAAANDNKTATPGANDNTPAIPKAPDWASYIKNNPDVLAEFNRLSPNNIKNNLKIDYTPEAFGKWHWEHYGQAEGRKPYASGGIMDRPITLGESGIGGEAGPEGILPLTNVGGRMGVHAVMPDMSEVVGELKSLRKEVDGLRKELVAANTQRGDMARDLGDRLDGVEDAVNRVEKRVAKAA